LYFGTNFNNSKIKISLFRVAKTLGNKTNSAKITKEPNWPIIFFEKSFEKEFKA